MGACGSNKNTSKSGNVSNSSYANAKKAAPFKPVEEKEGKL